MASFLPESIKKRIPIFIAAVLTLFFLYLGATRLDLTDTNFLTRVEFLWMDAKFRMRGEVPSGDEVIMVGIDDKTLDRFGSFRVFQRENFATLVDKLSEGRPKAIGFDMTFEDRTNPESDRLFAEAVERAGNVVLGVSLYLKNQVAERGEPTLMTEELENLVIEKEVFPAERRAAGESGDLDDLIQGKALRLALPELMKATKTFGFVNFHRDVEGGLRYQPQVIEYEGRLYPSLDLQLAKLYLDAPSVTIDITSQHISQVQVGSYTLQTDPFGRYMLNFEGPRGSHPTVSMVDVIDGLVAPETFRDKIVIIGSPAVGLADIVVSPFDPTLPGMELHANVIQNFIRQDFLYRDLLTKSIDVALILFFGIYLGTYLPRFNAQRSVFSAALLFVMFTAFNVLSFIYLKWILSFVYPGLALVVTSASLISYKYLTEEREKKRTKQTFQYYLDPQVIEQVMNQPDMLKLGGDKRELSVLFSDIRGFTSFSEKMAPSEVVHFLNLYLDRMTNLVFQQKGTLDKFIGDAVMAFWGAPLETTDHALRATLTALEMKQAVEDLRSVLVLPGGAKFEIGIGVNTGPAVVGNMGSAARFNFTVMGDNVNLSSRLEGMNKYYGTTILISDTTYEECRHLVHCRQLDTIQVKGRNDSVTIYEPMGIRRPQQENRDRPDRRGELNFAKRIHQTYILARFGERRVANRRIASERLVVTPAQEEFGSMYEHALALYRKGKFDAAEMAFDHVLSLSPGDGPSRLMKSRIAKYRTEYAGSESQFDPVYKFDEK